MSGLSPAATAFHAAVAAWQNQYADTVHVFYERTDATGSEVLVCTTLTDDALDEAMASYPTSTGRTWTRSGDAAGGRCTCPKSMGRRQAKYEGRPR